jgi:indole-3-glycerol phosphate synthase
MSETYLDRILAAKRAKLAARKREPTSDRTIADALASLPPTRDFAAALRHGPAPRAIAEFKRASPSRGPIREGADAADIARAYVDAGAAAISVLCDEHFSGSLDDLAAARRAVDAPLLCKDFVLERSQVVDARRAGADAVLLIVAALEPPTLKQLVDLARQCELEALCECHDAHEIDRALAAGARVVGVNARDLRTFEVDFERTIALRRLVPRSFVYVAESGISSHDDVVRLRDAGVDAILVGTALMSAPDPGEALRRLLDGPA